MEYADILRHYGAFGYFELPNLLTLTQEKRTTVLQTLHRWGKRGWITSLRRGFYAFPDDVAKNPLTVERAANHLYKDSYITGLWRLNQLGLLPEGVLEITNATRNNPATFDTPMGRFVYQHLSTNGFFGYEAESDGVSPIQIATPEKALLDFFWWRDVEWNENEFARWRLQDPFHKIDHKRLQAFARRWNQPRLVRAAAELTRYLASAPTWTSTTS